MMLERKRAWKVVAASVGGTLVVLGVGALIVIYTGLYNVAATDEHTGPVRWALRTTTINSIEARAEGQVELPGGEEVQTRGFRAYDDMCVPCHGAPGEERGWLGEGIRPTGPDLSEVASARSPAEILWAIEHGIKFTGMPALAPTHSREEMLELTAFVVSLEDMTAEEYAALREAAAAPPHAGADGGGDTGGPEPAPGDERGDAGPPEPGGHGDHGHSHSH